MRKMYQKGVNYFSKKNNLKVGSSKKIKLI